MVLAEAVRSRIVSRLRPWLRDEPGVELTLGFLRSFGRLKNLVLDTSALNPLIESSTRLVFKSVRVADVSFRLSPWSSPALAVEVRGVSVTFAPREPLDGICSISEAQDYAAREMKAVLTLMDPEGVIIHDIIRDALSAVPSRNRLMAALKDALLRHFGIRFCDISFELDLIEESYTCVLKAKELALEPQLPNQSCLLSSFVGLFFLPGKDMVLGISCSFLEFGLRENDNVNCLVSLRDPSICITLNSLKTIGFGIQIPQADFDFSPAEIPAVVIMLDMLSPKERKGIRSGRELWRLTAHCIDRLNLHPKASLYRLFHSAVIWIRYVKAYESLLSSVGYCDDQILKRGAGTVPKAGQGSSYVDNQLKVVDEMEKKLPLASIASARRIARHRALLHHCSVERATYFSTASLWRIFSLLIILWKFLYYILHSVSRILLFACNYLYFHHGLEKHTSPLQGVSLMSSPLQDHLTINVGEVHISLSPLKATNTPDGKEKMETKPPDINLFSICVAIKSLCFVCREDRGSQSFCLGIGEFQIISSSLPRASHMEFHLEVEKDPTVKRPIETDDGKKIILWSEPASFKPSKGSESDSVLTASPWVLILENCLGELQSDWKLIQKRSKQNNCEQAEHPFLLCKLKNLSNGRNASSTDYGLLKCSLTVGKLNLHLESSCMMSVSMLLGQVQHILHCNEKPSVPYVSSTIIDKTAIRLEEQLAFYTNEVNMTLLNVIPEKKLQIGVLMAGLCIKISPRGEFLQSTGRLDALQGQTDSRLMIGLGNIEIALWPASKDVLLNFISYLGINEEVPDYLWLKDPRVVDIPEANISDNFSSLERTAQNIFLSLKGLTVTFGSLEENLQSPAVGPMSVEIHSSTCRDYLFSFSTTTNALSLALSGVAVGTTALSYVDELCTLCQFFESIYPVASFDFINYNADYIAYPQELVRRFMSSDKGDTMRNMVASGQKDNSLVLESTEFIIDASFVFESLDIILSNSRKEQSTRKIDDSSSSNGSYHKIMAVDFPDVGIALSVQKSSIQVFCEQEAVKVLVDFCRIESIIFRQSQKGVHTDLLKAKTYEQQFFNQLYKFSLSACTFSLCVGQNSWGLPFTSVRKRGKIPASSSSVIPEIVSALNIFGERSEVQACGSSEEQLPAFRRYPDSSYLLVINIAIGEIMMSEYQMKNLQTASHQPKRLQLFLSVSGEPHTINCEMKGGYVFLETSALGAFIQCVRTYSLCLTSLVMSTCYSPKKSRRAPYLMDLGEGVASLSNHPSGDCDHGVVSQDVPTGKLKWQFLNAITVNMCHWSLTLAVTDGSGGIQALTIEADANFELLDFGKKSIFNLSRLSIISEHLQESSQDHISVDPIPHFYSNKSTDTPSFSGSGEENSMPISRDVHIYPSLNSPDEILLETDVSQFSTSSHSSFILKHLTSSFMIEEKDFEAGMQQLKSYWVGKGSISGFDLTITPSEIQMLLDLSAPLSEISGVKADPGLNLNLSQQMLEHKSTDHMIPDGAIVAIQDIHQHMYFAVEAVGRKHRLVGVLHYSLVGEKALFRVKYHNQKRWRSPIPQFFLTSLHAKNDKGEPLYLNFRPGSGFVELCSHEDWKLALWETFHYNHDSHENDDGIKSYDISSIKAFHLVNSKANCAVAFVDGLPVFIKKPGNPFKVKVFHDSSEHDEQRLLFPSPNTGDNCETNFCGDLLSMAKMTGQASNLKWMTIAVDKITLTILHEVSGANDKVPLIRGSVDGFHIIGQILPSKFRFISAFKVAACCFDAQRNIWREIISLVDTSLFFRSKFKHQGSVNSMQGAPVRFHFSMRQVDISLTELSLDILLFSAGKLNMAGPFTVRKSVIFANFFKVENNSGLSLLCHFSDNQKVRVSGKQSTSIVLSTLGDQFSEHISVSLSLSELALFSTSPIQISLSKSCLLAWRTRIISLQDSRTFPGPFLVVEVSKRTEDGLSLVLSPLLRIHNESGFSMKLQFRRPNETDTESASILLKSGDTIDDSIAVFDALSCSGGLKKALMSLGLGNFLLSLRPEILENFEKPGKPVIVEWSEDLLGEKAVRVSGIFDKLNYRFRKALGMESVKYSFSTLHCALNVDGLHVSDVYFLIQTVGRDVPVMPPQNAGDTSNIKTSPVAFRMQKEIFILPTIQVSNLLQTEIVVVLSENHQGDLKMAEGYSNFGKQAIIPCGSSLYFYVNPAIIYFNVTLSAFGSKCKPVNSGDWVKILHKQKGEINYFDINLEFGGGKYFASLRLSWGDRGIFEATIFTSYTLQNDSDLSLFCFACGQKNVAREEAVRYISTIQPEVGLFLPPKSSRSWFLKSNKLHLKWLEEKASETLLDLDVLSGVTELSLEAQSEVGFIRIAKLGVSIAPYNTKLLLPSQIVHLVPRYVISNESKVSIMVRQCYLEDDDDEITTIEGDQRAVLYMRSNLGQRKGTSLFDAMFRKHRSENEDSLDFIQFRLKEIESSWSGPICIASLGRFFVKFKKLEVSPASLSHSDTGSETDQTLFAGVHIVEKSSSLVLHFQMTPNYSLPYRIENCLHTAAISYYQKDSTAPETLGSRNSVEYVWDDLNLPHKLVVQIAGISILREINIDKVHSWKPFLKSRQIKGLPLHLPLEKKSGVQRKNIESHGFELDLGYEVFADGLTRVLRICEFSDRYKEEKMHAPCAKMQFRVSSLAINLLENCRQDNSSNDLPVHSTIIVARFVNMMMDSVITDQCKYSCIRVQSINVDEKWQGAPFASMIRRSQQNDSNLNENMLYFTFYLHSSNSSVIQVEYSSIVLQPFDLNLDEETLMRLVKFWRTSLSDSETPSKLFYFKHFEIHPIKIRASFLPGNQYSSYNSAQEALRALLHNVIKVPTIKNTLVELNGILLTHALVTARELGIKCAQHYSWYVIRAVYKAKGSSLLPPAFASIFDDSASSSLDVFFDPSDGSINLPGFTLGMFKFISTCISSKGFSGTKRYFGDLGKTLRRAGSNALFAAVTEISDSVLLGAQTNGFNGLITGFHQGILKLAMEPSMIGAAIMEGGPDRKINLDRSPGVDELYIEGYLQAMLDVMYKQEYLRVRVNDNQVLLKNLPPNSSLINEIVEQVKSFLISKALLNGEVTTGRPIRHLRGESEWRLGPTVLTLCEHLFVSFAIRVLRNQTSKLIVGIRLSRKKPRGEEGQEASPTAASNKSRVEKLGRLWAVGRFALSGVVAYIDGRLCRHIPNPITRRIVSGFMLSFLDKKDDE